MSVLRTCTRWFVAGLVLTAAALVVAPTPRAHALSCVGPETVAATTEHLFAGHAVDSSGDRILIEVSQVRRGERIPARVWVQFDLAEWMPWADRSREHGVPQDFHDDALWYLAADAQWRVNACTVWVPDPRDGDLLESITRALGPTAAVPLTPGSPPQGSADPGGAVPSHADGAQHGPMTLVLSAVAGVVLGCLVLGAFWWRRRRTVPGGLG